MTLFTGSGGALQQWQLRLEPGPGAVLEGRGTEVLAGEGFGLRLRQDDTSAGIFHLSRMQDGHRVAGQPATKYEVHRLTLRVTKAPGPTQTLILYGVWSLSKARGAARLQRLA